MTLRGRSRSARRYQVMSDLVTPRALLVASLAAAGATGIGLALAPSGSLATPGPLSAPHTKANVACAKCHGRAESTSPTARIEELTTLSCIGCHGAHDLRRGHKGALEQGKLGCATCHPAHASETVTFLGNGKARHATPTGTSEVAAPPIAKGVTVPILRADRCVGCHDAARRGDPLAPCVDTSGRTSPALVVRCLAEHGESGRAAGRGVCEGQHQPARFAAQDAAVAIAAGATLSARRPVLGLAGWLFLGPLAIGLASYVGVRMAKRRSAKSAEPHRAPAAQRRRLPVIDASRCLGCYACVDACAFDVLAIERYVAKVARPEACCSATTCETACPNGSLVMKDVNDLAAAEPWVSESLELEGTPGVFLAGDITGVPLIRNAVLQGRQAIDAIAKSKRRASSGPSVDADVVIVGAGPAGLAASLRAEEAGLTYVTLEQGVIAASLKSFPRGKLVFDAPLDLPLEGQLAVRECTKEELVAHWMRIVRTRRPRILEEHRVVHAERTGDVFTIVYERKDASRGQLRAHALLVAVGQRGTPRRLDAHIDASAESRVLDALYDARSLMGRRVLIVGLGDVAMEAAQALAHQPGTEVTVVHRGAGFARGREKNVTEVQGLVMAGRVHLLLESQVTRIADAGSALAVTVLGKGGAQALEVDVVLSLIGGTPSRAFLSALSPPSSRNAPENS